MSEEIVENEVIETPTEEVVQQPNAEQTTKKLRKSATSIQKELDIRDPDNAILSLRRENERLRKSLEEISEQKAKELAEAQIAEAKEQAKIEAQKMLDDRLKEMDRQAKNRLMKAELKAQATRAGVIDFDDLYAVMGRDALKKIEFNEDGDVANAGEVIAELKQAKPHLFSSVSTSSTTAVPTPSRDLTSKKSAMEMTRDEYEAEKLRLFGRASPV